MYSFDASSIIHVWDNYPQDNGLFSNLWEWFATNIKNEKFTISETAFNEVAHKIPECGAWLKEEDIKIHKKTATSLLTSLEIKKRLDIEEDKYTKGVGENDLYIIAITKEVGSILVTEEAIQTKLPRLKSNYKIPAVCKIKEVDVKCCNFVSLLKAE